MDYLWIAVAFVCGFLVRQINLPPLVGYLAAGFGLHAIGVEPDNALEVLSDLGVTLLLFTIGLKLNIKGLLKTEVWAGASGHMLAIVVLTVINSLFFAWIGMTYFTGLSLLAAASIGFAVSFSSTVCAVKILEEKGELRARHGQVAIGILVIQDIAAVIFVTLATDKSPSLWAFALLALPLLRPLLGRLLNLCGHGELLPLIGFFLAFSGGELFELVGLKAHLGALVVAMLLSGHDKSTELQKSLLGFKDLFLIGFFLSIGFTALPTLDMIGVALILAVALPFKAILFFWWLTRLKMRSRSAFLTAVSLSNYSEFGLIVCAASVSYGLLPKEWLVIIALAVSLSFVLSSVINAKAHEFYSRWQEQLKRYETKRPLQEDKLETRIKAKVLVVGMGRVGTGAYERMQQQYPDLVCGLDLDKNRVKRHKLAGRNVITVDAEDPEFWNDIAIEHIDLVMLAVPKNLDAIEISRQLKQAGFTGKIAAIAHYLDEEPLLLEAGVDVVFNFYQEAGAGFADQSAHLLIENLEAGNSSQPA